MPARFLQHHFFLFFFLSAQLHTFALAMEAESRAAVVTWADEQRPCVRLFFFPCQPEDDLHSHPPRQHGSLGGGEVRGVGDGGGQWRRRRSGRGRIEGVGGEVSFLSNSSSEMDAASLSWVKEMFSSVSKAKKRERKSSGGGLNCKKVQVKWMRQLARWGETCWGRTRREGEIADFSVRHWQKSPRLKCIYARHVRLLLPHNSQLGCCEKKKIKKRNALVFTGDWWFWGEKDATITFNILRIWSL